MINQWCTHFYKFLCNASNRWQYYFALTVSFCFSPSIQHFHILPNIKIITFFFFKCCPGLWTDFSFFQWLLAIVVFLLYMIIEKPLFLSGDDFAKQRFYIKSTLQWCADRWLLNWEANEGIIDTFLSSWRCFLIEWFCEFSCNLLRIFFNYGLQNLNMDKIWLSRLRGIFKRKKFPIEIGQIPVGIPGHLTFYFYSQNKCFLLLPFLKRLFWIHTADTV